MKTHQLKTLMPFFQASWDEHKLFEVRKDDRGFRAGDVLVLREWDGETKLYTGRELAVEVTYLLRGGIFGLEPSFVIMSVQRLSKCSTDTPELAPESP